MNMQNTKAEYVGFLQTKLNSVEAGMKALGKEEKMLHAIETLAKERIRLTRILESTKERSR